MRNITDNTDLMITFGVEPFLDDSICLTTPKRRFIEPLPQFRQQCLNPSGMLGKSLVGPLPVLFKIPAQVITLLLCEWVMQGISCVVQTQWLTGVQCYACNDIWLCIIRWRCQCDGEIKQLAHAGSSLKSLLIFVAADTEDEVVIGNQLLGIGALHYLIYTWMVDPILPVPPDLLVFRNLYRQV